MTRGRLRARVRRRRAFALACAEAFKRAQRAVRRAWCRALSRSPYRALTEPFTAAVAVPWEGHSVTVQATFRMGRRGGMPVHGIPA